MNEEWRYTAKSVTKYNPAYRDQEGVYRKEEWIGFFQLGENIGGKILTLDIYEETEQKYITATKWFFQFHNCDHVVLKNIEWHSIDAYKQADKEKLTGYIKSVNEDAIVSVSELDIVIKLVLRELMWAELFCESDQSIAVRFGHDFYMYFNSPTQLDALIDRVEGLGLFVN